MFKRAAVVPVFAVLALAACTSYEPMPPATGTILTPSGAYTTQQSTPITVVQAPAPGTTVVQAPAVVQAPTMVQVPVVAAFRPGRGAVDAVVTMNVPMSASAGASAGATARVYRLTLRMDDGTFQTLDQDNVAFRPGDRVEVTRDGHIVR